MRLVGAAPGSDISCKKNVKEIGYEKGIGNDFAGGSSGRDSFRADIGFLKGRVLQGLLPR